MPDAEVLTAYDFLYGSEREMAESFANLPPDPIPWHDKSVPKEVGIGRMAAYRPSL